MSNIFTFNKRKKGFKQNPAGTKGIAFVEFSAPTNPLCDYLQSTIHRLGFQCIGQHKRHEIYLYKQGDIHFLVNRETKGSNIANHASNFSREHGPTITSTGFWVKNTKKAYQHLVAHGATPYRYPTPYLTPAILAIGGSLLYCVEGESLDLFFQNEFNYYPTINPTHHGHNLRTIDHISYNVYLGKVNHWCGFYQTLFNFKQTQYFNATGQKTQLVNRALLSPCGNISLVINQSKDPNSQISTYLKAHKGEGIQHVALSTPNLIQSIESLTKACIPFIDIPSSYYATMADEFPESGHNLFNLSKYKILLDGETDDQNTKTLLHILTKNLVGSMFFEIIERQGAISFGTKNFMTLLDTGNIIFKNEDDSGADEE